ncbi:hypothetical protein SHKM778_34180 [Streptomyces sp. KM77-8]|uniref:Class I SAM-dependent methyltransferase n=1 Tax=Streptomyces haneummycinicus TaxID=3074435 RepID=A0AAT9HI82_9ACTN
MRRALVRAPGARYTVFDRRTGRAGIAPWGVGHERDQSVPGGLGGVLACGAGRAREVFWDAEPALTAARHLALFEPRLTDPGLPLVDLGCGNGTQTRFSPTGSRR